jgi:RNA polymerase sigma-70 factor (ECF subfamily)
LPSTTYKFKRAGCPLLYEDKELVKKTLAGKQEAFEMIVQKYQQPLLNYIGRTVGEYELALELTQDVFIKTYSSLHSYRFYYKFSTWLYKIASNYIIDYWRKKKIKAFSIDQQSEKEDSPPPIQVPSQETSIYEKYELSEIKGKIETALEKIPSYLRELFVWKHINEFSYQEIAEIKDLPVGTIKNRVFQAKELIRKQMEGMG